MQTNKKNVFIQPTQNFLKLNSLTTLTRVAGFSDVLELDDLERLGGSCGVSLTRR